MKKRVTVKIDKDDLSKENVELVEKILDKAEYIEDEGFLNVWKEWSMDKVIKEKSPEELAELIDVAKEIVNKNFSSFLNTDIPKDIENCMVQYEIADNLLQQMLDLTEKIFDEQEEVELLTQQMQVFERYFVEKIQVSANENMGNHERFVKAMGQSVTSYKSLYTKTKNSYETLQKDLSKYKTIKSKHNKARNLLDDKLNEITSNVYDIVFPDDEINECIEHCKTSENDINANMIYLNKEYTKAQRSYKNAVLKYKEKEDIVREVSAIKLKEMAN